MLASEEVIIESRADAADMQGACGAGGEAYAYVLFGHCLENWRFLKSCNMKSRYLSKGLDYEVTIKKRPNYCTDIALQSHF